MISRAIENWKCITYIITVRFSTFVNVICCVLASCIWDLESGKKTTDIDKAHAGDVVSMSLSPDKNTFITGSVDRTCKLWDLRDNTCKQIFFGHQADVNSVCVS